MGDGAIPAEQIERLDAIGDWMARNGESIVGTYPDSRAGSSTDRPRDALLPSVQANEFIFTSQRALTRRSRCARSR